MLVAMEIAMLRAMVARVPALEACHLRAWLSAAAGDITQILDRSALLRAQLPRAALAWLTLPHASELTQDLEWLERSGAELLLSTDPEFPNQLLADSQCPAALYVMGDRSVLGSMQLAMVGSRSATPAALVTARELAAVLARAGLTITSGLAVGIDAASHQGALLAGGRTVAVCGNGLDRIYPTQHAALAERVRARGALISQFPPRTPPIRSNFPRRNRLIANLTAGTLVVEAAHHSGSLQTAAYAVQRGLRVFAVPGSVHNPLTRGCHKLIHEGAKLVAEASDVLRELGIPLPKEPLAQSGRPQAAAAPLDKEYEMLLDAVGFEPATIDRLGARTGLSCESILSMLLVLELEGRIATYPGGRFGRIPE